MANKRTLSDEDIAIILKKLASLKEGEGGGGRTLSNKDLEESYKKGGKVKKYMGGGKVYASHNKRYSYGGKVSGRKATYKY